ncbi:Bor family protein, partial [bacterium]|nr:Bor family protein [bacterium]
SISFQSCYTYHVYQIGGTEGREQGNQPATEWQDKTLHALAWGAVRQDIPVDNCQTARGQRFGIEEVKVETNFGYMLISVVTLGIWVPLKVSWRCAKPPVPTGTLR